MFLADTARGTVVTLYLLPTMMADVEAKLRKELKPGTRIVSHDYPLPSWEPVNVVRYDTPEKIPISGTTLLEWMRKHRTATGTPFLFKVAGRHKGYGSTEFHQDLFDKATRGEPLLPGLLPGVDGPHKMVVTSA